MYIFNNGRKSLNDQLLTSFCQKSDLVGFLLLSDAHGLLCPQTPAKPYSCVCREKRFKGRTQENVPVVTWFLWALKLGHQNAKFAREHNRLGEALHVSHSTLLAAHTAIICCMLFSRYPALCYIVMSGFLISCFSRHSSNSKHSSSLW